MTQSEYKQVGICVNQFICNVLNYLNLATSQATKNRFLAAYGIIDHGYRKQNRVDRTDLESGDRMHEGEPGLQVLLRGSNGQTIESNGHAWL